MFWYPFCFHSLKFYLSKTHYRIAVAFLTIVRLFHRFPFLPPIAFVKGMTKFSLFHFSFILHGKLKEHFSGASPPPASFSEIYRICLRSRRLTAHISAAASKLMKDTSSGEGRTDPTAGWFLHGHREKGSLFIYISKHFWYMNEYPWVRCEYL